MTDIRSNIFKEMQQDRLWGNLEDASVKVLDREDFISRYTDVIALGDTAISHLTQCGLPSPVYTVSSLSLEDAIRSRKFYAELRDQDLDEAENIAIREFENRKPIIRSEAEEIVAMQLNRENDLDAYNSMNIMRQIIEFGKYTQGKKSRFIPFNERSSIGLPGILVIKIDNPHEIAIDKTLEERFDKNRQPN